jgi:hypothetical protein
MFRLLLGYAAMRGLPDCSGLSNKIFIHHSTLSQSRNGRSMTLASFGQAWPCASYPRTSVGCGSASVSLFHPGLQGPFRRWRALRAGGWFHVGMLGFDCGWIDGFSFRVWSGGALHFEADLPDHSGEFAGDGDFDFVIMHQAFLKGLVTGIEAVLGLP